MANLFRHVAAVGRDKSGGVAALVVEQVAMLQEAGWAPPGSAERLARAAGGGESR